MLPFARFAAAALLTAASGFAADFREVPLQIDPAQPLAAVTLESNGKTITAAVANGKAKIPSELSLPWKVAQPRFEPTVYTQADLNAHHPLVLRALGQVTGAVREAGRPINRDFVVLIRTNGSAEVAEHKFQPTRESRGAFSAQLPAGMYQAVVASGSCATRLRSGIVIKPGGRTDLGSITCEPTFAVSFRVIDAKTSAPIAGAKVTWDPSDAINAQDAKVMYARRWSATTDRRGAVAIKVGPAPIPLRWRVEANGYAAERTRRFELYENKEAALGDVKLRPATVLHVRIHLPADADDFAGGSIVLGEHPAERSSRYEPKAKRPIGNGDVAFPIDSYGEKRLWLENASGRKIFYRDIHVEPDIPAINLNPQPIEIRGRVTRHDSAIAGATVVLADPHDGRLILAKDKTDAAGEYALRTYQTGELSLYATHYGKRGVSTAAVLKKIHTTVDRNDYGLDFDFPDSGITIGVTDADTHTPIVAKLDARFAVDSGNRVLMDTVQTDDTGHVTFTGYPEGVVTVDVSAPAYRERQVQFPLRGNLTETHDVALSRSAPVAGRVVSPLGAPIAGAVVSAGYADEMQLNGRLQAVTDAAGRFHFDSTPEPGTPFYVIAEGWALAIVNLDSTNENVVALSAPSPNALYITENNAPPKQAYRIVAAPAGGDFIPYGVLEDLAEANGMNSFQLLANGRDGAVVLPQFLAPGAYDFFISHRPSAGQPRPLYDRLGRLTLPTHKGITLPVDAHDRPEVDLEHHRVDHQPDQHGHGDVDVAAGAELELLKRANGRRQELAEDTPAAMQSATQSER
jgi:hypothetical protein